MHESYPLSAVLKRTMEYQRSQRSHITRDSSNPLSYLPSPSLILYWPKRKLELCLRCLNWISYVKLFGY